MTITASDYRKALNEYTRTQMEQAQPVFACQTALDDPDSHLVAEGVCDLFITPEDYGKQAQWLKDSYYRWYAMGERPKCEPCAEWDIDHHPSVQ